MLYFATARRLRPIACAIFLSTLLAGSSLAKGSNKAISRLLSPRSLNSHNSVQFVRVSDGKALFAENANSTLSPASVSKLVTAAAVLSKFGPKSHFVTRFYRSGALRSGILYGDLVIVGDGDPFLVSELLWPMAADFRHLGIQEIRGDIVIDGTLFDDESRDFSRRAGTKSSSHAYDAPVSAFGVNFNTVALAVAPSAKVGHRAIVNIDPYAINGISVENRVTTSSDAETNLRVKRENRSKTTQKLVATGVMSKGSRLTKIYRSVNDHLVTSGELVRAFLKSEGIFVRGKVKSGVRKADHTLLYELKSYPMAKIVAGLNEYSNNYIADVLLKRLAAGDGKDGTKGTFAGGVKVLNKFLEQEVKIKSKFVMKNGSGLSTDNRLSSSQVCKLLVHMARRLEVFPEFLASLPAAGLNGTLRKRFKSKGVDSLVGKVRAKTGTLQQPISVSSLAGYLQHKKHGLVAFSIIQNGVSGKPQPDIGLLRDIQEQVIAAVAK